MFCSMRSQIEHSADVLVIDNDGNSIGLMPRHKAEKRAEDDGLDLVEVSSKGNTIVCRIMDEGKWKYNQKHKPNKRKSLSLKEVKFNLNIDPHDQQVKVSRVQKFLNKGHSVKISVHLKGREKANPSLADDKLSNIISELGDIKSDAVNKSSSSVCCIIHPAH